MFSGKKLRFIFTTAIEIMEQPAKSNRPPSDDFRQQKLKAWQPIMTPWKVIVLFIAIGIAFIPTGTTLLGKANDVRQPILLYIGYFEFL